MGRGQVEEQLLRDTLIDPAENDDLDPSYNGNNVVVAVADRGVKQPTRCRDSWAALLFYGQIVGISVVAGMFGIPAVRRAVDDESSSSSSTSSSASGGEEEYEVNYAGLIYACLIAGCASFALSGISLLVMSACPKFLIQMSLLITLAWSIAVATLSYFLLPHPDNLFGLIFGIIISVISACYACVVWRRIPFASSNLDAGLAAIKSNAGVILVAYAIVSLSIGYSVLWMMALMGVYDMEGLCTYSSTGKSDGDTTPEEVMVCTDGPAWGYIILLLLAYFWTEQVLQNTIHVIIAGVVSTWWFAPEDANSFCSSAIKDSVIRATTTSFGSICFGSLLVAIIETLTAMVESARSDTDNGGCAAFLLCIVDCLLKCLEGILEYFNKFAYIYVGMYGYGYLEAGKNVMTLFRQRGWTIIIADNLVSNVLSLFVVIIGIVTGCFGLIMNETKPSWFEGFDDAAMVVAFVFSFIVGVVISAILLSVVNSSVNTVLVCFAEAPGEFEENHPELSSNMREAWRNVYPDECGF